MTDMNVQKANEKSYFCKNMTSKNQFSNFYQKPPTDLNSGSVVQFQQCPQPRQPLSGIPTAQIGVQEVILQSRKPHLTPMIVRHLKNLLSSGELTYLTLMIVPLDTTRWCSSNPYLRVLLNTCDILIIFLSQYLVIVNYDIIRFILF